MHVDRSSSLRRAASMASIAALLAAAPAAPALDISLPPETAAYRASDLPGYQLVQENCMLCHSAQYVQTQPPAMPRSFWEATVRKMKTTYGAPFAEGDIPAMVDYLVQVYGALPPAADAAPGTGSPPK